MTTIDFSMTKIGASFSYSPSLPSVTVEDMNNIDQNNQQRPTASTQVNISPKAREKLTQEQSELGQKLANQLQQDTIKDVEKNKNKSDTELLDKLIAEIQEQIKEAQQELRSLKSDRTETAQQKQKMVESQLMSLNASLIGLFGKKLKALEESAP